MTKTAEKGQITTLKVIFDAKRDNAGKGIYPDNVIKILKKLQSK